MAEASECGVAKLGVGRGGFHSHGIILVVNNGNILVTNEQIVVTNENMVVPTMGIYGGFQKVIKLPHSWFISGKIVI